MRWRRAIAGAGSLTIDESTIYVVAANEGVHALDMKGNLIWRQGAKGAGEPAPPVVSGSYLIYGLSDRGMFIADKFRGTVYQYFNPGDGVSSVPTLEPSGDRLYMLSNRGILYAFHVERF